MFAMIPQLTIDATDLAAASLFMYGLKRMSSPVTAPSGIFVAGIGMLVAILASTAMERHKLYICEHGEDMPEVRDGRWNL
jgi:NAD/NADP transhydrogenase beta subunit